MEKVSKVKEENTVRELIANKGRNKKNYEMLMSGFSVD